MAVSENDVDRELLNRIAEAYFAKKRRQDSAAAKDGATGDERDSGSKRDDRTSQKATPQHRRHWRDALRFTPLVIL
jgi:hypothetical protein